MSRDVARCHVTCLNVVAAGALILYNNNRGYNRGYNRGEERRGEMMDDAVCVNGKTIGKSDGACLIVYVCSVCV